MQAFAHRLANDFLKENCNYNETAKRICSRDADVTTELALFMLECLAKSSSHSKCIHRVAKAVITVIPSHRASGFVIQVGLREIFGRHRLHAVALFECCALSPFLLLDAVFQSTPADTLKAAVRFFPVQGVTEVLRFAAANYGDFPAVVTKLEGLEEFQGVDLGKFAEKWSANNVRKVIDTTCETLKISPPREAPNFRVAAAIPSLMASYLRGEMEDQDFIPIFRQLTNGDASLIDITLNSITGFCPSLASRIATTLKLHPRPYLHAFTPSCADPSDRFHRLVDSGEVIHDNRDVRCFVHHLRESRFYAIDVRTFGNLDTGRQEAAAIVFCLRAKVFLLLPKQFPETVKPVSDALRGFDGYALRYRWHRVCTVFEEQLGFRPPRAYDVEQAAASNGVTYELSAMAKRVTGGSYCRRGSNFSGLTIPSVVAQRHCAIRAKIIYEDVVELLRLREPRRDEGRDDRRQDERRGRKRDSEAEPRSRAKCPRTSSYDHRTRR